MSLLRNFFLCLLTIMLWTPLEVMGLFQGLEGKELSRTRFCNVSTIDVLFIILLTSEVMCLILALLRFRRRHRVKAMFKVKSILHEKELRDSEQINSLVSDRKKHSKGSRVMHLRERFNTGLEQNAVSSSPRRGVINDAQEMVDNTSNAVNPTTSTQHKEETHPPEVTHPESPRKLVVDVNLNSTCNNVEDDINQSINVVCPTPKSVKDIIHSWEQIHLRSLLNTWSTSDRVKIDISHHDVITPQQDALELHNAEKVEDEQSIVSLNELVEDNPLLKIDWEEQLDRGNAVETFPDWKSNLSKEPSEGGEDQSDQNIEEPNLDWIYDVCRPQSDWECLRQERYRQMLDPFNKNRDIKQLLERKNVSSFLCSAMRDKIDQLMLSRTGQPLITGVPPVKPEEVVKEEGKCAHEENEQEGGEEDQSDQNIEYG